MAQLKRFKKKIILSNWENRKEFYNMSAEAKRNCQWASLLITDKFEPCTAQKAAIMRHKILMSSIAR